jgi:hypothetical protein
MDVVTAFLNPEINNDNIHMTLPAGWAEGLDTYKIIIRLRKALYGLKQALWLWHDNFNAYLLCPVFTQAIADPNLIPHYDDSLILLYVDDISKSYPETAVNAVIEVTAKLSEKYK